MWLQLIYNQGECCFVLVNRITYHEFLFLGNGFPSADSGFWIPDSIAGKNRMKVELCVAMAYRRQRGIAPYQVLSSHEIGYVNSLYNHGNFMWYHLVVISTWYGAGMPRTITVCCVVAVMRPVPNTYPPIYVVAPYQVLTPDIEILYIIMGISYGSIL